MYKIEITRFDQTSKTFSYRTLEEFNQAYWGFVKDNSVMYYEVV